MKLADKIRALTKASVFELYGTEIEENKIIIRRTPDPALGDYSIMIIPIAKMLGKEIPEVSDALATELTVKLDENFKSEFLKGFLNLTFDTNTWLSRLGEIKQTENFGHHPSTGKTTVVEYCGPNTNKPLHIGHIRNMVLGYSIANILEANGNQVHKVNILNDRGIQICKSMLAWQKFANGDTPESTGRKGDLFVGDYYVRFAEELKKETQPLIDAGKSERDAENESALMAEAREMLIKWEANDPEVRALWRKMNDWVIAGHNQTYRDFGVEFEKDYLESEHYLLGKDFVQQGLAKGIFFEKEDKSIWVDLSDDGLDEKLLLRGDGTSVYLTQDLGIAHERYKDYQMDESIYVVGDAQAYHFKVLKLSLQKLNEAYADGIYHMGYGMMTLPDGSKMKSREGTTVDADDLIADMISTAEQHTKEAAKQPDMHQEEAQELYKTIGLGAMKYFILKVGAKKKMMFDPKQSIDLIGHTGPFIQYAYARIQSIKRKYGQATKNTFEISDLELSERELIQEINAYPQAIASSAQSYDPSILANYVYNVAKLFNKMYGELTIIDENEKANTDFRVALADAAASVIKDGMNILGITVPERM